MIEQQLDSDTVWHGYTFHFPLDAVLITTDITTLQTLSTDSTAKAREGSDYVIASYTKCTALTTLEL